MLVVIFLQSCFFDSFHTWFYMDLKDEAHLWASLGRCFFKLHKHSKLWKTAIQPILLRKTSYAKHVKACSYQYSYEVDVSCGLCIWKYYWYASLLFEVICLQLSHTCSSITNYKWWNMGSDDGRKPAAIHMPDPCWMLLWSWFGIFRLFFCTSCDFSVCVWC